MCRLVRKMCAVSFLPLSATCAKTSMMMNDGTHGIVRIVILYEPAQDLAQP